MTLQQRSALRRSRGVGLAEALVAITILALAGTVALVLYNSARKSFKIGDNLTEQQQVVRIAFDEISRELRQAGLNTNPDDHELRPDEQIELAAATAIVFRADFDAGDPTLSVEPEEDLAMPAVGAKFPTVSTGNDEIVAYVLGNASSNETLSFEADVLPPVRDGVVDAVDLASLALTQDDPPYTLYRISLDENGAGVRTPVIDNVRFLRFTYYDSSGNVLAPPGGMDDSDGLGRNARAAIRRIGIEIEGLTRDPQMDWDDPVDPVPGPGGRGQYRKFNLAGDVTPRNLGMVGVKDLDASFSPPSTPPPPSLYPGHCEALWIEWAPNPAQDEVVRYELRYGTDPGDLGGPVYSLDHDLYLDGLADAATYYVTVQAVDDSGNISNPSPASAATIDDINVPKQPTDLTATSGADALEGEVQLNWTGVTENSEDPADARPVEDPLWPEMRDFGAYEIFRHESPGIALIFANLIATRTPVVYHDREVVNCRTYHYTIRAQDVCRDQESPASIEASGSSKYSIRPATPINVRADWVGVPWGSRIEVKWDRVVHDVNGAENYIENYKVQKAEDPPPLNFTTVGFAVDGATSWVDPTGYFGAGDVAYFRVVAHDDCVNESDPSDPVSATCNFDGDVTITEPSDYYGIDDDDQWLSIGVDVAGGSATYDGLQLAVVDTSDGSTVLTQTWSTMPPWLYEWDVLALPSGSYRIDVVVQQTDNNCVDSTSRFVTKD